MNRTALVAVAIVAGAAAFAVSLFAQPDGALTPPDDVFPLLALLVLVESIAFGVGSAYVVSQREILFGARTPALERAVAFGIAFLLLAPWPHDSLHRLAELHGVINWRFLAAIEFVFHTGIVPVGLVAAAYLASARRSQARP